MNTYRELVYMVLDELKVVSDDAHFTPDHIVYLLDKYRAFILKQKYSDLRKPIPESNYQLINLTMELYTSSDSKDRNNYFKSIDEVPTLMTIGNPSAYTEYQSYDIALIRRERMRYTGYNRYLHNIAYASISDDKHLLLKTEEQNEEVFSRVKLLGIFENTVGAYELEGEEKNTDFEILDKEFPMEASLVNPVIELVIKEMIGAVYRPKDSINNATDDLSSLAGYLQRNLKSNADKEIFG